MTKTIDLSELSSVFGHQVPPHPDSEHTGRAKYPKKRVQSFYTKLKYSKGPIAVIGKYLTDSAKCHAEFFAKDERPK